MTVAICKHSIPTYYESTFDFNTTNNRNHNRQIQLYAKQP